MKTKWWVVILCLMLALTAIAGCQSSPGNTESDTAMSNESMIFGQVSVIDGGSITLALGTMSDVFPDIAGEKPGAPPDNRQGSQGTSSGAKPGSNDTDANSSATLNNTAVTTEPPDTVSGATESSGETPSSGQPEGGVFPGSIDLSGKEITISVSNNTAITVQSMGESTEGRLSDIEVGDILSVTMSGDVVTAITVMQGGNIQGRYN